MPEMGGEGVVGGAYSQSKPIGGALAQDSMPGSPYVDHKLGGGSYLESKSVGQGYGSEQGRNGFNQHAYMAEADSTPHSVELSAWTASPRHDSASRYELH